MATRKPRAVISWSGGKDSLAALAAVRDRLDVVAALTMFDESGARSRSHGLAARAHRSAGGPTRRTGR